VREDIVDKRLQKYIEAVVGIGVNIQQGQKLLIRCSVDTAYIARLAMEEAYKRGAADVMVIWDDDACERIDYLLAPEEKFGKVEEWRRARMQHLVDEKYNLLSISSDDPENLKGVCPDRIKRDNIAYGKMNKPRSQQIMASEVQWVGCSVPSPAWARKVFPDAICDEEAVAQMWEAIFAACRIDENDPVENWRKHTEYLQGKADAMNSANFQSLRFKNSLGTDLEMELPKDHFWVACGEEAKTGVNFVANMPTEEVFTAPQRDGVNGVVYATKPLVYMGDVIDGFWLRFEKGRVVDYAAEKNQHLLEKLLTSTPNADFLGEVALVPHSSPISQSGILWYNTLYDENASCHLALGKGYPDCVKGAVGKSEEDILAMGLNQSLEHEDFMIGSACMDVVGIMQDGLEVQIFAKGEWVL